MVWVTSFTITGPSHLINDSTSVVVKEVTQTSGAIGYAATGQVTGTPAPTIVSVDSVAATAANAESNTYKFWNIEHMYTKGAATPLEQALIDYMSSQDGLKEEATLQFIALGSIPASSITAHN